MTQEMREKEIHVLEGRSTWKRKAEKYGTLHEFACHPCAASMLIFSGIKQVQVHGFIAVYKYQKVEQTRNDLVASNEKVLRLIFDLFRIR